MARGRVTVEKTAEQFHKERHGGGVFRLADAASVISWDHRMHHLPGGDDLGVVH